MAATGRYITESDVDNWTADQSESDRLDKILEAEDTLERLTKDVFYPKVFDVYRDGNASNRLNVRVRPRVLSISAVELFGVTLSTSYYTWDHEFVYLDVSGSIDSEAELRYLLKRSSSGALFPLGRSNVRIVGTCGWPERLDFDNGSGTFLARETITGGTSGATATIYRVESDHLLITGRSATDFTNDEEIAGGTSAATADVNSTTGAVIYPPRAVKRALIMMVKKENDETLYTPYHLGSESMDGYSYSTKEKPLTGVREIDLILGRFVHKKVRMAIV